jgi:hypothetical protein
MLVITVHIENTLGEEIFGDVEGYDKLSVVPTVRRSSLGYGCHVHYHRWECQLLIV